MPMQEKAVVIIPTYNERENIEKTVSALLRVFDTIHTWDMHVLVVDDTSPDKTYQLVEALAAKENRVHLLVNAKKAGLGGAYTKGMHYAFDELTADAVIQFDADLSHDPTKIPLFLKDLDAGADVVIGTRYKDGGSIPQNWGLHRKLLSFFGNLTIMTILGNFKYRDWTGGYRAIRKSVFKTVAPLLKADGFLGYTFQIGLLYFALKEGFTVVETVPYHFKDRLVGQSKIGPEYFKNALTFIFKMRVQSLLSNRIIKFGLVGGLGAVVQLSALALFRMLLKTENLYELAVFLSIETAVVSNFILNNIWTFNDKSLSARQIPAKFIAFNLSSFGSILIQMALAAAGKATIGIVPLFTVPILGLVVDTGLLYVIVGIGLGMVWNFFAYTRLIWKTK